MDLSSLCFCQGHSFKLDGRGKSFTCCVSSVCLFEVHMHSLGTAWHPAYGDDSTKRRKRTRRFFLVFSFLYERFAWRGWSSGLSFRFISFQYRQGHLDPDADIDFCSCYIHIQIYPPYLGAVHISMLGSDVCYGIFACFFLSIFFYFLVSYY